MTGFATVRGSASDGVAFVLMAKSVNHRFLDLQFRMPGGFDAMEVRLRQLLKARLRRGHVDVTLSLESLGERAGEGELRVDDVLLASAVREFRAAASRHGLSGEPDLNVLLRLPGVMGVPRGNGFAVTGDLEGAVIASAAELVEALLAARAAEGSSLGCGAASFDAEDPRGSLPRLRRFGNRCEAGRWSGFDCECWSCCPARM